MAGSRNPRWIVARLTVDQRLEVECALHVLSQRVTPATPAQIGTQLKRLINHFKNERSDVEWEALALDYIPCLSEFSLPQISEAITTHLCVKSWFPKIAELRALLVPVAYRDREHRRRAMVLLGFAKPHFLDVPEDEDPGPARDMAPVKLALTGLRA